MRVAQIKYLYQRSVDGLAPSLVDIGHESILFDRFCRDSVWYFFKMSPTPVFPSSMYTIKKNGWDEEVADMIQYKDPKRHVKRNVVDYIFFSFLILLYRKQHVSLVSCIR